MKQICLCEYFWYTLQAILTFWSILCQLIIIKENLLSAFKIIQNKLFGLKIFTRLDLV